MYSTKTTTTTSIEVDFFIKGILNQVGDPLFVKDENYRFILLNDAACSFIGLPAENILNKTDYDLFPKEEANVFRKMDNLVFETGEDNVNEESFTDVKGNKKIISTKKSLFVTPSKEKILVLIIQDITEIKSTEKKLLATVDQLAEFAYVVSHDIKGPLRTINSFVGLMDRRFREDLPKDALIYLDYIKKASNNANDLVRDLLEFSTIVANDEAEKESIKLSGIISDVEENLMISIEENSVTINQGLLPEIIGERVRLYQLFQNLIANAIKFRKKDVDSIICISSETLENGYEIRINDNGIGIKEEYLQQIFKLFTRLNRKDDYNGSGVGLTTCEKIMKQLGGTIQVESTFGEGTTFILFFPK